MKRFSHLFFLILCTAVLCGCGTSILPEIEYHVRTKAVIESRYLNKGPHAVKCYQAPAGDFKLKEFRIWYPEELEKAKGKTYPAIIICNGTGYRATRFMTVFRHLASWGFIVIGTEEEWTGKGRGAILSLNFLLKNNASKDSLFYRKIDRDRIGIAGHSQGGAGAVNAITKYPEGKIFKALFTISGINRELAESWLMRCPYDPELLTIPVMMTATSNPYGWDENHPERKDLGICPLSALKGNRDAILRKNNTTVVIARVADKKKYHADNLAMSTPYMTAWFVYWLQGDLEAGAFFLGNDPELLRNPCWQDAEIHLKISVIRRKTSSPRKYSTRGCFMKIFPEEMAVLRIYTAEKDHYEGLPFYEWIVQTACGYGLAGATIFRGIGSYGLTNPVLSPQFHQLTINHPVVIEIVDKTEKLEKFIQKIEDTIPRGLMTLQPVTVRYYGRKRS